MALNLPPLNLPIIADLSGLTSQMRQMRQVVDQATANPPTVKVNMDTSGAVRSVQQLQAQVETLTRAMTQNAADMGSTRTAIAAVIAEQARLRAEMAQTENQMRQQGASARDIQAALGQTRTAFQLLGASLAEQRVSLTAATAAQQQYRTALSATEGALRQVAQTHQQTNTQVKAAADEHVRSVGRIQQAYQDLKSSFVGGAIFGGAAAIGGTVINAALDKLSQGFAFAKQSMIGFNASLEQSKIAFTTFLGSAQQANNFLAQLQDFAKRTPFDFPGLVDASKRMLAFGFSAQQIIPMLTAVGNAASALGGGAEMIDRITLALGQMSAKGRVQGDDLRQLQEAGVKTGDIFAIVAEQMGTTTKAVKEMQSQGTLSADAFIQAFQKWSDVRFGDMMEKQSHTFMGAMSNIRDAAEQVLAKMGTPVFDAVSHTAQAISAFTSTPQFAVWAATATVAIQGVTRVLGTLANAALAVGRSLLGALGFKVPSLDLSKMMEQGQQAASQQQQQAAAAATTATNQASAAKEMANYAAQASAASAKVKEIDRALEGVKGQQQDVKNQIDDINQGYTDQIGVIQKQIDAINQLTPEDISRRTQGFNLKQQEIQIKLTTPDTTELDATLAKLKREKEDLQSFDTSQWDGPLASLRDQLQAIDKEDLGGLDKQMKAVQESLYQLGKQTTADLDQQISALRDKIAGISTASIDAIDKQISTLQDSLNSLNTDDIDRQISDLNAKLTAAPDTTAISGQMAVLAAQIAGGAGDGAAAAFGNLSKQKQDILTNYQASQSGIKGQIAALTEERRIRQQTNDDEKKAIEAQIKGLQDQKTAFTDANAAQKAALEEQIKGIETVKASRQADIDNQRNALQDTLHNLQLQKDAADADRAARKQGIQDQIDGITKAKDAAQKAHDQQVKNLDDQITLIERQKADLLAPSEAALARVTREQSINDLLTQQAQLTRDIANAPLKDKIDEIKKAQQEAIAPLEAQAKIYERQAQALEAQKQSYQQQADDAKAAGEAAQAAVADVPAGGIPGALFPDPVGGATPDQAWLDGFNANLATLDTNIRSAAKSIQDFFNDDTIKGLLNLKTNIDNVAEAWHGITTAARIAKDLYRGDWDDLLALTGKKAAETIDVYDEFGHKLGTVTKPAQDSWLQSWTALWNDLIDGTDLHLAPWITHWFGAGGVIATSFSDAGTAANKVFGEGGVVGKSFDDAGTAANKVFGEKGVIGTSFSAFGTLVDGFFGEGGTIGQTFSAFGTWMQTNVVDKLTGWFGAGGSIGTMFSDFGTAVDGFFGEKGTLGQTFSTFGTWMNGIFGEKGSLQTLLLTTFPNWLGGLAATVESIFKDVVNTGIIGPLQHGMDAFTTFANGLGSGINWVADKLHLSDKIHVDQWGGTTIPTFAQGTDYAPGGPALTGEEGRELVVVGSRVQMVGSRGPQIVELPLGARVIPHGETEALLAASSRVPSDAMGATLSPKQAEEVHHMIGSPLFGADADAILKAIMKGNVGQYTALTPSSGTGGLLDVIKAVGGGIESAGQGIGSLAGDALDLAKGFVSKGASWLVDQALDAVGVKAPDLGTFLTGSDDGILSFFKDVLQQGFADLRDFVSQMLPKPPATPAGGGAGALSPLVGIIKEMADKYGIPADIIGAIILHESGGHIGQVEIGGGKGRGLMQVDGGTWPQAYDPRMVGTTLDDARYQIDIGAMILQRAFDAAGGDVGGALTNYAGSGFAGVHGKTFYQELLDMGLIAAADAALAGGGTAAGDNAIVNAAMNHLGEIDNWSGYCETFVETAIREAGGQIQRYATAYAHAQSVQRNMNQAPAGATLFWAGNGWADGTGHVAIAVGDGSNVITTQGLQNDHLPIAIRPWEGLPGYLGWAVPGMATGAYVTQPTLAVVGEGGQPEIVAPEKKLRQIMREEGAGGGFNFTFANGAISVGADGNVSVDQSKIRVSMRRRGFAG